MRTLEPSNFKSLFNFDVTLKDEIAQVEFLQSYYIARLKMLRKDNPEMYITRELADAETFYKDMISATACYHHTLMIKKKQNERNNQEGGGLPSSLPAE